MTLLEHLKQHHKPVAEFAVELGEAESTIRKIAYGQRQPSLPLAVKISEATNGEVSAADLLLPVQPVDDTEPSGDEDADGDAKAAAA